MTELITAQEREQVRQAIPEYEKAKEKYSQARQQLENQSAYIKSPRIQRSATDLNSLRKIQTLNKNIESQKGEVTSNLQQIETIIPELQRLSSLPTPEEYQAEQQRKIELAQKYINDKIPYKFIDDPEVRAMVKQGYIEINQQRELIKNIQTSGIPSNIQEKIDTFKAKGLTDTQAFSKATGLRIIPGKSSGDQTAVNINNKDVSKVEVSSSNSLVEKPSGVISRAPSFKEQFLSYIYPKTNGVLGTASNILLTPVRTVGFLGQKASGALTKYDLSSNAPYQSYAQGNLAAFAVENIPYSYAKVATPLLLTQGTGTILNPQSSLAEKGIGILDVGLGILGAKGIAAERQARAIEQASKNPNIVFTGTATDTNLNVISKAKVLDKDINVVSNFKLYPIDSNAMSMVGKSVSVIPEGNNMRFILSDAAGVNQRLNARVSAVQDKVVTTNEPILDNLFFIKNKNPINDVTPIFSTGLSSNKEFIVVPKTGYSKMGLLDTLGESRGSILKKKAIEKGSFENNVERNNVVGFAKEISEPPIQQGFFTVTKENPDNIIGFVGGEPKVRIYKKGGISYVYKPTIKGTIRYKPSETSEVLGFEGGNRNQVLKDLKQNAPLATIKQETIRAVKKAVEPQITELKQKSENYKSSNIIVPFLEKNAGSQSLFYGTGMYEKTSENQTPTINNILGFNSENGSGVKTNQNLNQGFEFKINERNENILKTFNKPMEITKEVIKEKPGSLNLFKTLQMLRQAERQKQPGLNNPLSSGDSTQKKKVVTAIIPKKKKGSSDNLMDIFRKLKYNVFVRRKGKDTKVASSENELGAVKSLFGKLKETLGAGGYVEANGKKINLSRYLKGEFIPSKREGSYRAIQARKYRLGTGSERREIQFFKKSKGKKKLSWW